MEINNKKLIQEKLSIVDKRFVYNMKQGGDNISSGKDIPSEQKESEPIDLDKGIPIDQPSTSTEQKELSGPIIPERPQDALTGSQFAERLEELEKEDLPESMKGKSNREIENYRMAKREQLVYEEILKGNIPNQMREFKEVTVERKDGIKATFRVTPDYLMIGSDEDAIRVPMTPSTAQLLATQFNCSLPTDKMVDAIAKEAKRNGVDIGPITSDVPKYDSWKVRFNQKQHDSIVARTGSNGITEGNPLIIGPKKDIVLPYRNDGDHYVMIYGWHKKDGSPIQGYSGKHHEWSYMDYSHGVRLVSNVVTITYPDGRQEQKNINDVLADENLHTLLAKAPIKNAKDVYSNHSMVTEKSMDNAKPIDVDKTYNSQSSSETYQETTSSGWGTATMPESSDKVMKSYGGGSVDSHSGSEGVTYGGSIGADTRPETAHTSTTSSDVESYSTSSGSEGVTYGGSIGADTSLETAHTSTTSSDVSSSTTNNENYDTKYPNQENNVAINTIESNEHIKIQGETAFFGSSSVKGLNSVNDLKNQNHKFYGENGFTAKQLLNLIKNNENSIKDVKNGVVFIGTNDLAGADADKIFERIEAVWTEIRRINPNIKLNVCTIPPFGKWHFTNPKLVNERREELNNKIRENAKKYNFKLIDLDLPKSQGGLASEDRTELDPSLRNDHLHAKSDVLADVIARGVNKNANDTATT